MSKSSWYQRLSPERKRELSRKTMERQKRNREAHLAARARFRARHPGYWAQWKYGLSEAEYFAMLEATGGNCPLCAVAFDKADAKRRACVDHSHETNVVRGVICGSCNTGLGMFRDSPATLRAAADYLDRHAMLRAA